MRTVSFEEAAAVGGAACEDLTMSVGLTGVSISGSLGDWGSCIGGALGWISDTFYGFSAHYSTGIPYGEPHAG